MSAQQYGLCLLQPKNLDHSACGILLKLRHRGQSFTSLKADLRQDINGGIALMEHVLEGKALLMLG